jgi:hypothetical protein
MESRVSMWREALSHMRNDTENKMDNDYDTGRDAIGNDSMLQIVDGQIARAVRPTHILLDGIGAIADACGKFSNDCVHTKLLKKEILDIVDTTLRKVRDAVDSK